jgi:hypothetical protein
MKEEVEQALRRGGAPPGYTVVESDGGTSVTLEYPGRQDVAVYTETLSVPNSRRSRPGVFIRRCSEILEQAGYAAELVPGPRHHTLVVRRH